jgi:hypothetical protein
MAALYVVMFHVWHYVTEVDYILYFGKPEIFLDYSVLVSLGKLTANFAQRKNLKNFIKFLK